MLSFHPVLFDDLKTKKLNILNTRRKSEWRAAGKQPTTANSETTTQSRFAERAASFNSTTI